MISSSAILTSADGSQSSTRTEGSVKRSSCDIDIHIEAQGDVNIYNCATPIANCQPLSRPPCPPVYGTCIPVVAGAKHKLSRDQKLGRLAEAVPVPSAIAAATMHMIRRFMLGKTAANPLEELTFATLRKISPDLLSCTLTALDAAPLRQRNRLLAQSLLLDPNQPLEGRCTNYRFRAGNRATNWIAGLRRSKRLG
jgi:hypothetical protein